MRFPEMRTYCYRAENNYIRRAVRAFAVVSFSPVAECPDLGGMFVGLGSSKFQKYTKRFKYAKSLILA